MNKGVIQQIGRPIDIYNEPENAFVADFIGESNILDGTMLSDFKVAFFNAVFDCSDKGFRLNEKVDVVIRPEDIRLVDPALGQLVGECISIVFKGVHYEMLIESDGYEWMIHSTSTVEEGAMVGMCFDLDAIHIMRKVM